MLLSERERERELFNLEMPRNKLIFQLIGKSEKERKIICFLETRSIQFDSTRLIKHSSLYIILMLMEQLFVVLPPANSTGRPILFDRVDK